MLTYGFFNSLNNDRKYNSEQMSYIIDALVKDGVMQNYGEFFAVKPGDGMTVVVEKGMAWFDSTWTRNDGQIVLDIDPADVTLTRYDAVVLEVDHSVAVRANSIKVIKGAASSTPAKPTMVKSSNINQYPLAYIKITPGVTTISTSAVEIRVGQSDCPWITGILQTIPIDTLFDKWDGEFNTWFERLQSMLDDNVVANLQNQIDKKADKSEVLNNKNTVFDTTLNRLVRVSSTGRYVALARSLSNYAAISITPVDDYLILSCYYNYSSTYGTYGEVLYAINVNTHNVTSLNIDTTIGENKYPNKAERILFSDSFFYAYLGDLASASVKYLVSLNKNTGVLTKIGKATTSTSMISTDTVELQNYIATPSPAGILYYISKTASTNTAWTSKNVSSLTNILYVAGTNGNTVYYYINTSTGVKFVSVSIPSMASATYNITTTKATNIVPLFQDDEYTYFTHYLNSNNTMITTLYKINKQNPSEMHSLTIPQDLLSNSPSKVSHIRYIATSETGYYFYNDYNFLIKINKDFTTYVTIDNFFKNVTSTDLYSYFYLKNEAIINDDDDFIIVTGFPYIISFSKQKAYSINLVLGSTPPNSTLYSNIGTIVASPSNNTAAIYMNSSTDSDTLRMSAMYASDVMHNIYTYGTMFKLEGGL